MEFLRNRGIFLGPKMQEYKNLTSFVFSIFLILFVMTGIQKEVKMTVFSFSRTNSMMSKTFLGAK